MSFPYCIIDGTFYSFCTTSCIHVNLTKIALPLILGIYYWLSILAFFLPTCCLLQVSGRKDKTLYSIPPNFSRKKIEWILLLNGACLFTHIWVDNSYQASRFQILYLEHLNFFLLTKKKTAFQVLFLWRLSPFALPAFHLYRRSLSRKRVQKYMDFLLIQILSPYPSC